MPHSRNASWIAESLAITVVEYLSTQPLACPHGNAKADNARPFVRTPAGTMEKVGDAVINAPPKSVYDW